MEHKSASASTREEDADFSLDIHRDGDIMVLK
jgi:hypothetical protein